MAATRQGQNLVRTYVKQTYENDSASNIVKHNTKLMAIPWEKDGTIPMSIRWEKRRDHTNGYPMGKRCLERGVKHDHK